MRCIARVPTTISITDKLSSWAQTCQTALPGPRGPRGFANQCLLELDRECPALAGKFTDTSPATQRQLAQTAKAMHAHTITTKLW